MTPVVESVVQTGWKFTNLQTVPSNRYNGLTLGLYQNCLNRLILLVSLSDWLLVDLRFTFWILLMRVCVGSTRLLASIIKLPTRIAMKTVGIHEMLILQHR